MNGVSMVTPSPPVHLYERGHGRQTVAEGVPLPSAKHAFLLGEAGGRAQGAHLCQNRFSSVLNRSSSALPRRNTRCIAQHAAFNPLRDLVRREAMMCRHEDDCCAA
jgi:hypothetical protein